MTTTTPDRLISPAILRTSDGLIAGIASDVPLLDGRALKMEISLPGGERVTQFYPLSELRHLTLCKEEDTQRLATYSAQTLAYQGVQPVRFGPSPLIKAWERDHDPAYRRALRGPLFDSITVVENMPEGALVAASETDVVTLKSIGKNTHNAE